MGIPDLVGAAGFAASCAGAMPATLIPTPATAAPAMKRRRPTCFCPVPTPLLDFVIGLLPVPRRAASSSIFGGIILPRISRRQGQQFGVTPGSRDAAAQRLHLKSPRGRDYMRKILP